MAVPPGSRDDIDVTDGRLGAWVVGQALTIDGPIHEWRTEIGWPVLDLATANDA